MQEASTIEEVVRRIPKINVALDEHQVPYQPTMIECEGMVTNQPISILFDLGASLSYVSPNVLEGCQLQRSKFQKTWLVQLTIEEKQRVVEKIEECPVDILRQHIYVNLNIVPLGS